MGNFFISERAGGVRNFLIFKEHLPPMGYSDKTNTTLALSGLLI